jgi:uncharacterized delta-60 repeat protein
MWNLNATRVVAGVIVSSAALFATTQSSAQLVGVPDPTFNGSGVLIASPFAGTTDQSFADIVVQPDGKTLVIGTCTTTGGAFPSIDDGKGFCVFRYNVDGSLDTTFGVGGRWKRRDRVSASSLTTFDSSAVAAALQSDGTLVVAGFCRNLEVCINRVTPAGNSPSVFTRLPASFANLGDFLKLAIQADDKILLTSQLNLQPTVARFTALGPLDTTYGTGGIASASSAAPTTNYRVRSTYVDPASGKLLGLAIRRSATGSNAEVFRFNTNGTIDGTFDADGFVSVTLVSGNFSNDAFSFAPRPGGGVEVAILGDKGAPGLFLGSIRLSANGAGDTNHGPNGVRYSNVQYSSPCLYEAAKVLPDQKIVYAGHTAVSTSNGQQSGYDICRVRLNADQSVDSSFDNGPTSFSAGVPFGFFNSSLTIAVGQDAKIVVGDGCLPNGVFNQPYRSCLQRYDYLSSTNCYDVDGDGTANPLVDGLVVLRAQLGLRGNAVTDGIGIATSAPRNNWSALREFMLFSCGMRGL